MEEPLTVAMLAVVTVVVLMVMVMAVVVVAVVIDALLLEPPLSELVPPTPVPMDWALATVFLVEIPQQQYRRQWARGGRNQAVPDSTELAPAKLLVAEKGEAEYRPAMSGMEAVVLQKSCPAMVEG